MGSGNQPALNGVTLTRGAPRRRGTLQQVLPHPQGEITTPRRGCLGPATSLHQWPIVGHDGLFYFIREPRTNLCFSGAGQTLILAGWHKWSFTTFPRSASVTRPQ